MQLAEGIGVDAVESLALLRTLEERGVGSFVVRVINSAGGELRRFASMRDITDVVTSEFGESIRVMPENVDVTFERVP